MKSTQTVRYKGILAYDGTDFSGFQFQKNGRTVQDEVEKVLTKINNNQFIRIHPAGRTDAGVHAARMVIHFDYPNTIQPDGLFRALNVLLPADISLKNLEKTDEDFHARYYAIAKTYTYRINNQPVRNPFTRRFALHHPYQMDLEKAQRALGEIKGRHDFTSFSSTKTVIENKVRTIYEAKVEVDPETNEWLFTFTGDGFLYNMIRIIVGTVISIADGREDVSVMKEILEARDRTVAGKTIAAEGLRLECVFYSENELKKYLEK